MNIIVACEGDAESAVESFSGITKSIVDHFRAAGHGVVSVDADLYGGWRLVGALSAWSPNRARWRARYHLGAAPFTLRSRIAAAGVRAAKPADALLLIGATFFPHNWTSKPYFLYCDSNIRLADRDRATGHTWASALTPAEIDAVARQERAVYQGAAGIFTISELLRSSFISDFGVAADRVIAVHAGPNMAADEIPPRDSLHAPGKPVILFVGADFVRKGGDILLDAFRIVRQQVPEAELHIIGPRSLPRQEPGVVLKGFLRKDVASERAALWQAYREATVFCMPTRSEPFGIVFLEAMYFGVPCVATRVSAVPEMVVDGETGYLVELDDAPALADRLVKVLSEPAVRARLGQAGRKRAEERFSWPQASRLMLNAMRAKVEAVR